ncbi:MAG: chromosomal replication initiator protein DnaA [Candidatus Krumholzibacteriota bacterium]|nr:chromosomal replication initiator protein DnaA [Candidatus Krumholzibacteriota bacterium]
MQGLGHLWETILDRLKGLVNPQSFQTWFVPTRLVSVENARLVIEGPNPFFIDWLAEHHREKIALAASETLGEEMSVEFVASPTPPRVTRPAENPRRAMIERRDLPNRVQLNGRYTFGEFVVGGGNRLTHAAAMAVADRPARVYNPFFIYGGVGLGKTHLIQAIAHHILENRPETSIAYVSTESFMNELIHAIRKGSTLEFKQRYRNVDVLLVDDIQFLAGKESTQEEFFFTFNALHEANKQIVVTSDRPPKEIPSLQERLISRFEWGLITDIQPPDLEMRIAILRKKVAKERIEVPDDVLQTIAENVKNNIRELEGSLIRVLACASLTCREISVDMATELLHSIGSRPARRRITPSMIQKAVSQHFDVPIESLKARTRIARVVLARQTAMHLCRELTDLSLVQIGGKFGGRDHSTVLHAIKKIDALLEGDSEMRASIKRIHDDIT